MQAFLNMRSSSSQADPLFRPKNWREKILRLYPNGSVALTAMTALMASEMTDDPEYNWFEKILFKQAATVTGVYNNNACDSAYVSGGVAGQVVYVKCTEDVDAGNSEFRVGHQVLIALVGNAAMRVNAKVVSVERVGTGAGSTKLGCKLLEADDNGGSKDLSDANRIIIIGNVNPEGSQMPDSVMYDPTKSWNYTQIFRSSLSLTRTRMRTKVRYGSSTYQEAKRDCLELHGIEMEKAFLFGVRTEGTGENGQPERTTGGLMSFIPSDNLSDYRSDTDFTGKTWLEGGEDFIDKWLETLFRYGPKERTAYVGTGALRGINRIVKNRGYFQFTSKTLAYGIQITEWVTPFGTIDLYTHPLFSQESLWRNACLLFEPSFLRYRYIDDTYFQKDNSLLEGSWVALDGIKEGYLTEAGIEVQHPICMMYLDGLGLDA